MRIGLIADIHGNAWALRRVLRELDRLEVDAIACLGDLATPGPWPEETITLLAERDIPSVMGNTDQWLLAPDDAVVSDVPEMDAISHWAAGELSRASHTAVAWLPMHRDIDLDGSELLLVHGSPRGTTEGISAVTPEGELTALLAGMSAPLVATGHTHVPLYRRTARCELINPGSVGLGGTGPGTPDLPPSRPANHAEFAVLETTSGTRRVSFHRIPLDVPRMLSSAAETGMPHPDWWAALWAAET
jgi:putative phosphoesterase